jgi:hypothetical protein
MEIQRHLYTFTKLSQGETYPTDRKKLLILFMKEVSLKYSFMSLFSWYIGLLVYIIISTYAWDIHFTFTVSHLNLFMEWSLDRNEYNVKCLFCTGESSILDAPIQAGDPVYKHVVTVRVRIFDIYGDYGTFSKEIIGIITQFICYPIQCLVKSIEMLKIVRLNQLRHKIKLTLIMNLAIKHVRLQF